MNLSANVDFDIKRFFQWWGQGLLYWVPEKIKPFFSQPVSLIFLSVMDGVLTLKTEKDQVIAQFDLNTATVEDIEKLVSEHEILQKAKYIWRFQSRQASKTILHLPIAAKENLQQVIAFEIDKYTPFTTEHIYFAAKPLTKEVNGQFEVLLVFIPKAELDPIYQQLKALKIYPDFADYEQAPNNYSEDYKPYNLLPKWNVPVKNRLSRWMTWGAGVLLVLLMAAVLVFPVWQLGETVDLLRQQLKSLGKDAVLVQNQQLEIDGLIEETAHLLKVKSEAPSITELTNTLSGLIPTDTWLTHFKYQNGKLQIQGQSPAASALIGLLEASELFSNARFVSPLTQDKKTGRERFQISVDINAQMGDLDE